MSAFPLGASRLAAIDTVLLDLDGTLLDLNYDTTFWLRTVPQAWGATRGLDAEAARVALQPAFQALEGTLDWYCIDYWSRALQLDIASLKRRDTSLIRWLPGAREFVRRLRRHGKRVVLATNSHPEVLAIKDAATGVVGEVHAAFSSHQFGAPKEDDRFWAALSRAEPFDRERTLFVDDSASVLRAAHRAGVAHLVAVRRPDSQGEARPHAGFAAVDAVAELLEG